MRILNIIAAIIFCQGIYAQNWAYLPGTNWHIAGFYNDSTSNMLMAYGAFDTAGTVPVQGLAEWDGSNWGATGIPTFPVGPSITSIVRYNGQLLLGGHFPNWNFFQPYIASWNGTSLDSLAELHWEAPNGMLVYQNDLIVYGYPDSINNVAINEIGSWDGLVWTDLGQGAFLDQIWDVVDYQGTLYACATASADSLPHVFKYVGGSWQIVGQPFYGTVYSLCVYNNELYAGGYFSMSNNAPGNGIARLDTTTGTWRNPGGGVSSFPSITNMIVYNGYLYAIGDFDHAGGVSANGIAKWDGNQWCGLGLPVSDPLYSLASYNGNLYVGCGQSFDGNTVHYFTQWIGGSYVDSCGSLTGIQQYNAAQSELNVFPNPASDFLIVNTNSVTGTFILTDQLGREEERLELNGQKQVEISVTDLAEGMYFYQFLKDGVRKASGKIIVLH